MKLLRGRWGKGCYLCVGLDPTLEEAASCFPNHPITEQLFCVTRTIVDQTVDLACAYKPNIAFYLAHLRFGLKALELTIDHIRTTAPHIPIILDAKIGDIGKTNTGYLQMLDSLGADAITVHPYLGRESLEPILARADKGVFVLCRTSNPGAGEFQDLQSYSTEQLFLRVAQRVTQEWNPLGNCGLVVGATYPEELRTVRDLTHTVPILIPGVGTQGGDLKQAVTMARRNFLINVSSGLLRNGLPCVGSVARHYTDEITAARLQPA